MSQTSHGPTPQANVGASGLITSLRLGLRFGVERLQTDLASLTAEDWVKHFKRIHYQGGYYGAALISANGSPHDVRTHRAGGLKPTPLLERCTYFQEVLDQLHCPLLRVRLLKMDPGGRVKPHIDSLDLAHLQVARLHVPIVTNADVVFVLDNRKVQMRPGECWFLDTYAPHSVVNNGAEPRVHLVIDCAANEFFNELLGFDLCEYRMQHRDNIERLERVFLAKDKRRYAMRRLKDLALLAVTDPPELARWGKRLSARLIGRGAK